MAIHAVQFVQFLKRARAAASFYNAGEKASFPPEVADHLVRSGVVRRIEPDPAPEAEAEPTSKARKATP